MGKKLTSSELSSRFINLAENIGLVEEPLDKNLLWKNRLSEIINYMPEQLAIDLVDQMQTAIDNPHADAVTFAKLHNLTPAEEKLLTSLVEGHSVPHHAKNLGISVNTGRVHMQRILDKTGANGQLDLIRMLHNG